jgi:hypothetical protein
VKKLLTSLLAGCFLVGILSVTGCSKKDTDTKKTTETKTTETKTDNK